MQEVHRAPCDAITIMQNEGVYVIDDGQLVSQGEDVAVYNLISSSACYSINPNPPCSEATQTVRLVEGPSTLYLDVQEKLWTKELSGICPFVGMFVCLPRAPAQT